MSSSIVESLNVVLATPHTDGRNNALISVLTSQEAVPSSSLASFVAANTAGTASVTFFAKLRAGMPVMAASIDDILRAAGDDTLSFNAAVPTHGAAGADGTDGAAARGAALCVSDGSVRPHGSGALPARTVPSVSDGAASVAGSDVSFSSAAVRNRKVYVFQAAEGAVPLSMARFGVGASVKQSHAAKSVPLPPPPPPKTAQEEWESLFD